ncbi:outer membrane protein assembly factor BamE [Aliikangiella sp. IMCC44653]
MLKKLSLLLVLLLTACVYRLDVQQGNILAQKDIDKLRPGLTKNQVVFVLGSPVLQDTFADNKWVYLYTYNNARLNQLTKKKLELDFVDDKLVAVKGDYDLPASFQQASEEAETGSNNNQ